MSNFAGYTAGFRLIWVGSELFLSVDRSYVERRCCSPSVGSQESADIGNSLGRALSWIPLANSKGDGKVGK